MSRPIEASGHRTTVVPPSSARPREAARLIAALLKAQHDALQSTTSRLFALREFSATGALPPAGALPRRIALPVPVSGSLAALKRD